MVNESVNGTLNSTIANATANATHLAAKTISAAQSFIPLVFTRLWELVAAPFHHQEMLWIIFPLFFTLIVMEIYYERNKDEEMSWGAALANSLVLIFVSIDLIKVSFNNATPWEVLKDVVLWIFSNAELQVAPLVLLLIVFLGCLGLAVTLINYFHLLPRKIAFGLSGHPPINYLAYFAIAIVYSTNTSHPIPFDLATAVAGVLLFIVILIIVFSVKKFFTRFEGNDRKSIW